ncbi:MAG: hypothetical protein V7785_20170 [Bermanella sp.]
MNPANTLPVFHTLHDKVNFSADKLSLKELNALLQEVRAAKFQSVYIRDFEKNLASESKLKTLISEKQLGDTRWLNPLVMGFAKWAVVGVLVLVVGFWGAFILGKLVNEKQNSSLIETSTFTLTKNSEKHSQYAQALEP